MNTQRIHQFLQWSRNYEVAKRKLKFCFLLHWLIFDVFETALVSRNSSMHDFIIPMTRDMLHHCFWHVERTTVKRCKHQLIKMK